MTPNHQQLILNLKWLRKHAPITYLNWMKQNTPYEDPLWRELENDTP